MTDWDAIYKADAEAAMKAFRTAARKAEKLIEAYERGDDNAKARHRAIDGLYTRANKPEIRGYPAASEEALATIKRLHARSRDAEPLYYKARQESHVRERRALDEAEAARRAADPLWSYKQELKMTRFYNEQRSRARRGDMRSDTGARVVGPPGKRRVARSADHARGQIDPSKTLEGNAIAYFYVGGDEHDGDPESLVLRRGDVPLHVVARYLERRLGGGTVRAQGAGLECHAVGADGRPYSYTTPVKVEARK